jgi:hypothetical protein
MTVEIWGQDVTATPAGAIGTGVANAVVAAGGSIIISSDNRDPTAVVAQATVLDQTSGPVTVRSFKSSLNDQSAATKDIFTSPASWPNGATELQALYGAGSQGIQGSSGGGNGINGTGTIGGIKLFAIVRVAKDAASTITSIRFGTGMGVKALLVTPTIRDIDQPLTDAMWEVVETAIITTGATAQPFEWGNGSLSVWSQMFGWTFNHTYSNVASDFTQVEVAEAWVEVHGPLGSGSEGSGIEFTFALNLPPRIIPIETTF